MELTEKLLTELQKRLKIGNRRGVHLNAIPANSRYKFDLKRLSHIDKNLPDNFINSLLSDMPLKFRISWKNNVPDLNTLFEDDQIQLVRITKAFENLINQTEAIESEKGINTFGFGFPILARRDRADNKLTVAPILIWSLRIKRTKEFNTWEILRNEDDPIYINEVLINHLQGDSNIEIEQVPSEMLDDGLIDKNELVEICSKLIRAINTSPPDDLEEMFRQKLDKVSSIGDKAHYDKLPLNNSNSLIDFGGLFSIFEVQKQNIINDYDSLMEIKGLEVDLKDMKNHSFQPISSVETDPSQQSIMHALETTRNILIQGPPGTGKSQTLTAILINALENNKRTIVVCEKRTALEVLYNALIKKGLNHHCVLIRDIVKDRKTVVDSVRDRVDNYEHRQYVVTYSKESLDNKITKVRNLIININKRHLKLDQKLFENKSWSDIVGILLAELKGSTDDNKLNIDKSKFNYSTKELNSILDLLQEGQKLYIDFFPIQGTSFINSLKLVGDNPYIIEQAINEDFDLYGKQLEIIRTLLDSTKREYEVFRNSSFKEQLQKVFNILNKVEDCLKENENNIDFLEGKNISSFSYKLKSLFSKTKRKTFKDFKNLQKLLKKLNSTITANIDIPFAEFEFNIESNKNQLLEFRIKTDEAKKGFETKIITEFQQLSLLNANPHEIKIQSLPLLQKEVNDLADKIKRDNWIAEDVKITEFYKFINDVNKLIHKKNEYFNSEKNFLTIEFNWFQFFNRLSATNKEIINELKTKSNWSKAFLIFYLNSILLNSANSDLPTNDDEYNEFNKTFKGIGNEQIKFIKNFWFSKQINEAVKFDYANTDLTIKNLYNKKSSYKNKRLSLRQIVQKDTNLFSTFFPIILTSPDVASNLFKGMNRYFDIVMFDEASQLRLEDNLPAMLKGKQIIIAGDEHQMPPSNYFSKVFDGTVDDEDDIEDDEINLSNTDDLLGCESLLDAAGFLKFKNRFLEFHYRSRHPFLIDFSNHAFYNQRLKPLPNNFDYVPIKYIQVNGTFSDHTNEAEAEMVLSILDKNINRLPEGKYPTVGIATFNITQRNLIKSKILERQKFSKFLDFNNKIQELEENGMFIKNLENIQGDERDVIILSTTYGIGKDRKFAQRFGPINHSKGYRLLNVIITRAKFKIYVCSSIPEQVFMDYNQYLTTEGSNNKRAVFYAYLAYCKAVSEKNNDLRLSILTSLLENTTKSASFDTYKGGDLESPFEEEVYQSLADRLGTDKLIPQLQFAGFRIDIVYDPKLVGVPKVAIECDGAKYHSSREAYLYDLHRQKILEKHGFVFHRIWSTNWWRNPNRETSKLIEFIKQIESTKHPITKDYSRTASAFTDDIKIIEHYISQTSFIDLEKDKETINSIEEEPLQIKIIRDEVKLNSKVRIKFVNDDKNMNVHIVSSENDKNEVVNGIQKVHFKKPLAISLMGHIEGDIVKIGNLDNFVEILKITN